MSRVNLRAFLLSAIALCACAFLSAQSDQSAAPNHGNMQPVPVGDDAKNHTVRGLPATAHSPADVFDITNRSAASPRFIRVLSEDEMTREDRDLVADAESSIQERAGVENLEFNEAGWTYHQLVCPALPRHLFLRFTRDDGTRQMSMFSASVPRGGNGRVRIIPIVRKGYSLFSPAPIGAMTIAAFNRIRAEEGEGAAADWLGTGLCYAALAGANPELGEPVPAEDAETPVYLPPTLSITKEGGAIIHFADVSVASKPMEWSMSFDARGKLIKATHSSAYAVNSVKPVPGVWHIGEAKP